MASLTGNIGLVYTAFLVFMVSSAEATSYPMMTTDASAIDTKHEVASGVPYIEVDNTSERKATKGIEVDTTTSVEAIHHNLNQVATSRVNNNNSERKDIATDTDHVMTTVTMPPIDTDANNAAISRISHRIPQGTSETVNVDGLVNTTGIIQDESTDIPVIDNLSNETVLPDPIDNYANHIHFYTPDAFGVQEQIIGMLHEAFTYGSYFVPVQTLNVIPVASRFTVDENGNRLVSTTYVVSHNGEFIQSETISSIMKKPEVKKHFYKHLADRGLKEYKLKPREQSWAHKHVVAIVVPSCVVFVIVLFIIIISVRSRSANSKSLKKKNAKFTTPGSEKCGPPPSYDDVSYGIHNPAYDFESDGSALP